MKVQEMHYEVKRRINKVDSNQNRNLLVPEIDIALNEAQMLFIKTVAEPRVSYHLGVETTQRNIDELRTIIVHDKKCTISNEHVTLPDDYLYFLRGYIPLKKGDCDNVKARLYIQRHNDLFEESEFTKSSFSWRTVNGLFVGVDNNGVYEGKIKLMKPSDMHFSDDPSNPDDDFGAEAEISYIRRPKLIYYGSGFGVNGYKLPSGYYPNTTSSSNNPSDQDCELPESTHSEIVDIAAMIITGDLASPDYQYKMAKIKFNELK